MTKPITSSAWRGQSGKLSAQLLSRRELLLYGQSDRPAARLVNRAYRRIAGGVSRGARTTSLRDRSRRDPPGSPARDLDAARWRCGFRHPLAPDQKRLFACFAPRGTDLSQPRRQRRARDLAEAILGTYAARRGRFCASPRLHPLQSGEARSRSPRAGLAVFLVSPLGAPWCLSGGLGRRSRR
jgi:hypothetical protein